MRRFSKVLIANRAEIAVRVISTAKQMGYQTVAVYSEPDAHSLHVQSADQSVALGGTTASESYLDIDKIINAAKASGADAIHPGYGFLSENADFAERCGQENIVFIGPKADAIRLMGSKRLSKLAMLENDVPCIPGYQGENQDSAHLTAQARDIGAPIMLKASAGGGGRGMRLVHDLTDFEAQLRTAQQEAMAAFGSDEMILERAVIEPRHIEIQVFADEHGNVIYLGERDCSIQRRHQKVVEESPSPFVDDELRAKMGEAAVNAARACRYIGAGTVEFLVDADKHFYFLEMNTRLQVEHPVTELVTGQDLVRWQLQIANGQALPLSQEQVVLQGHAVEVRLYAEDPRQNFMPQTGTAVVWRAAQGDQIRVDNGVLQGQAVSPFYDPMLAKLIAYGQDRNEAIAVLRSAVKDTVLLGVNNNLAFLAKVLNQPDFIRGAATTAFLAQVYPNGDYQSADVSDLSIALAAVLIYRKTQLDARIGRQAWHSSFSIVSKMVLSDGDREITVSLSCQGQDYTVFVNKQTFNLIVAPHQNDNECVYQYNGIRDIAYFAHLGKRIYLQDQDGHYEFTDITYQPVSATGGGGDADVKAAMDGAIVEINVSLGQAVKAGDTVAVLEAMKMAHQLNAGVDGVVTQINTEPGQQVKARQVVLSIEPDESAV